MTVTEMLSSDKLMLVPSDVAPVLNVAPYSINVQAKADPSKLGFPVVVVGTRVKIPRVPFLKYLGIL